MSDLSYLRMSYRFLADKRLTSDAKQLGAYWADRLTLPGGWVIRESDVCERFGWPRSKYFKAMKCLREAGYVTKSARQRLPNGQTVTPPPHMPADAAAYIRGDSAKFHNQDLDGAFPQVGPSFKNQVLVSETVNYPENNQPENSNYAEEVESPSSPLSPPGPGQAERSDADSDNQGADIAHADTSGNNLGDQSLGVCGLKDCGREASFSANNGTIMYSACKEHEPALRAYIGSPGIMQDCCDSRAHKGHPSLAVTRVTVDDITFNFCADCHAGYLKATGKVAA